MRLLLLLLVALGGCTIFRPDPTGCEAIADRDPAVEDFRAKTAGNPEYGRNHADDIRIARVAAIQKCERERGIIPKGGGIEQARPVR